MKTSVCGFLMLFLLFCVSPSWAEVQQTWAFEEFETGSLPEKWEIAETKGKGSQAVWEVQKDETSSMGEKVLAITVNPNRGEIGNLLISKTGVFKNIEFSTKIKAGTIGKDAGGGIIWRVIDEKHYYLAQWNAESNNLRLYVYINAKPSLLESVSIEADPETWHQLDVVHHDEAIEILFDNESKITVEDNQLDFKGWVGLWAQGSALPSFDDVIFYSEEDGESE